MKRFLPIFAVLATSVVELSIANRKFGIFSGGFGQSQAVNTMAELTQFLAEYAIAQTVCALFLWEFVRTVHGSRRGWPVPFQFCIIFTGVNMACLIASYQLHAYFSDTVSFTLIKQLGGGSFVDALLFGLREILNGFAIIAAAIFMWWICWRWMRKRYGIQRHQGGLRSNWRRAVIALIVLMILIPVSPRLSPDVDFALNRTLVWNSTKRSFDIASDFDRDGYGLFGRSIDAHPFDASLHPLALDIPGDGIDQDGFGGDLTLVPVPEQRPLTPVPTNGPNVVIVVMESVRSDVLGKRIDGRPVAPNLESLAQNGVAVVPSFSHAAFTTASLKSIFAGTLLPVADSPSLFRELKQSGYHIGVYSGQAENFGDISATVGMRTSADNFIDAEALKTERAFSFAAQGSLLIDEKIILDHFMSDYRRADAWTKPNFLYFNFQSAHFPYDHPGVPRRFVEAAIPRDKISEPNRDWVQRTYWNAVAKADDSLGRLIALLKDAGQWNNTILLVTGDHGESLFEDGFLGHGHIINERQYATFMVINQKITAGGQPISISEYRGLLLDLLTGRRPKITPRIMPFLHIGPLEAPTEIGLYTPHGIATLRLDTRRACVQQARCVPYENLSQAQKRVIDALVARWGSERWAVYRKLNT